MLGPLDIRNKTPEQIIGGSTGGLLSGLNPDEMRRLELLNQSQADNTKDPQKKSVFQKIGKKLTDPTVLTGLAAAFDSMTASPDPALQKRYSDMLLMDKLKKQGNQTAAYLRDQGQDQLATMIEANPSMAGELMKAYAANQMKAPYSRKGIGTVQVDPVTGQQYMVEYDPNVAGGVRRVNIEGATSLTPEQKIKMEADAAARQVDVSAAQDYGQDLFDKFIQVDKSIGDLERLGVLSEKGAITGFFGKFLPAMEANTAEFQEIAKRMGIDIINSATFGALSATELRLALSTGFNQNLKGEELQKFVRSKISAQRKLRKELLDQSRVLITGKKTLSEFLGDMQEKDREATRIASYDFAKDGVTQQQWDAMNLEQRKAFIEAGKE